MNTRKEYNNRSDAKLVNPGFTLAEYEESRRQNRLNGNTVTESTPKEIVLNALFTALQEVETKIGEGETTRKLDKAIFYMELLTNK